MATTKRKKSGGQSAPASRESALADLLRDLLPSSEVAEILGLTQERVQQFCRQGRLIGAVQLTGRWHVPRAEVYRFKSVERPAGRPPMDN